MICCVYKIYKEGEVVYVGQTTNLLERMKAHKRKDYDRVGYILVDKEHLKPIESCFIAKHMPKMNRFRPTSLVEDGNTLLLTKYKEVVEIFLGEEIYDDEEQLGESVLLSERLLKTNFVVNNGQHFLLNANAKILYAYLQGKCAATGSFIAQQADMADDVGVTPRTLISCLNLLKDAGIVLSYNTGQKRKRYVVKPIVNSF